MKSRPPLHGYNTNYRREGTVYHIQTEDLGPPAAAVVTQVFTGGTILAVKRTPYVEVFDDPEAETRVRELMRRQHKSLLVALRDGNLGKDGPKALSDSEVSVAIESSRSRDDDTIEQPLELEDTAFDIVDDGTNLRDTMRMERPPGFAEALIAEARKREAEKMRAGPTPKPEEAPAGVPEGEGAAPVPPAVEAAAVVVPREVAAPRITARRAEPTAPPKVSPKKTMPLFKTPAASSRPPPVPAASRRAPRPEPSADGPAEPGKRSSRSPRVFSDVSSGQGHRGEDLLAERSLDEVILSYLAEDLDRE